jgi:hypothetical protein
MGTVDCYFGAHLTRRVPVTLRAIVAKGYLLDCP